MSPTTQRTLRRVHTWIGMFFAPGILFFSATGFLQTAGFAERGAPAWIAWSAGIHKHQQAPRPRIDRPRPPDGVPGAAQPGGEHHDAAPFVALRPYVVFLSWALFLTTAIGVWIGLSQRATRRTSAILLAAGVVVPVALMLV